MMNHSKFIIFYKIIVMTIIINVCGSSISHNIQFEDLDGNNYDLFNLLSQGKYIALHMTFND